MPTFQAPFLGNPEPSFLGPTAYAATLYETQHAIGGVGESPAGDDDLRAYSVWNNSIYTPDRPSQIQKGAACLALLLDMPTLEPLAKSWHESANSFSLSRPWVAFCLAAVKEQIYDRCIAQPASERDHYLLQTSSRIFRNTLEPLLVPKDCDTYTFGRSWTHESLRWEAVAVIFHAVGTASMIFHHSYAGSAHGKKSQGNARLAKPMLEASDACLSFCEEIGHLTDPELWALSDNTYLGSLVDGDASNMTWRRVGDSISAVVSRGLHHSTAGYTNIPLWLSEVRKRTFATAFCEDKGMAAFMGRPPRLPSRYCAMQIPLDVAMKHLEHPDFELAAQISRLDQDGWNTQSSFQGCVLLRTSMMHNVFREEILEFSLTSSGAPADPTQAQSIITRFQAAWDALPAFIRDGALNTGADAWIPRTCHLNFIYNNLLLQRAMVKKLHYPKTELLKLSRQLLAALLDLLHPTQMASYSPAEAPWLLTKYGLPAAGVVALELLLEIQSPTESTIGQHRSEVIQNLSSLVSCLRWAVTKLDGNYRICVQSRVLLQRILDRVLDPGPVDVFNAAQAGGNQSSAELWSAQVTSEPEFWDMLPNHPLLRDSEMTT